MNSFPGDAAILVPPPPSRAEPSGPRGALAYPGFRWFFAGLLLFAMGVWVMDVAQRWVVQELTGSPFYVGLMAFGWGVSVVIFSFPGGVLADRVDRIRLITVCRSFGVTAAVGLGVLVASGNVQVWHVVGFSILWGICVALEVPGRQALFPGLIHRNDLAQAIALTNGVWSTSIVVGPVIAGWLIASFGSRSCFFVTAVLHVLAVLCYRQIRSYLPPKTEDALNESPWQSFVGGLSYIQQYPVMLGLILLATLNAALSQSPTQALLPSFAADVLGGNASTFGLLLTAQGAGAVLANLALALSTRVPKKGRLMATACLVMGLMLISFSFMAMLVGAMALLFLMGFINGAFMTLANTLIQTYVNEEMRGRVLSSLMLIWGVGSAGSLAMGALGSATSVPFAFATTGVLTIIGCGIVLARIPALSRLD